MSSIDLAQFAIAFAGSTIRQCDIATMITSTLSFDNRSLSSSQSVYVTISRKHSTYHFGFSKKYVRFGASAASSRSNSWLP